MRPLGWAAPVNINCPSLHERFFLAMSADQRSTNRTFSKNAKTREVTLAILHILA